MVKNRMDIPDEYEPVLPGKVQEHLAKKKTEAAQDSLLTQTSIAVGNVIEQLKLVIVDPKTFDKFDVQDLTPDQFRELKSACVNHLSHLIPGIEKEKIDD